MLKLWDFFDEVIICDDETYPAKPDPAAFNDMSKRLNLPPNELLYVGDNPLNDVRGAWNSGFIPVWVKTTGIWPEDFEKEADYAVDDVSSVPNLVKEINNPKNFKKLYEKVENSSRIVNQETI